MLSLIEEADGDNIEVSDLICMMLQIGASDPALRRELGAIKKPTLLAFNDKIGGFEQARKTEQSRLLLLAWLPRALLNTVKTLLLLRICIVWVSQVEGERGAAASHCAANASDVLVKITCSHNVLTQ